jgi:hypothetical protein
VPLAALAYVLLTCALMWPLPLHLWTHLLGSPGGDTGVYVWNLWIFRHELLRHAQLPFSTDHLFAYSDAVDFALHNYTPVAGLLALPLIGPLGVVATFNVLMIALVALSGFGVFVLARRLGLEAIAAWAGGAIFIASPVLTARQTAHFSLVIAMALPLFLWALLRALEHQRVRDAVLVGSLVALASYSDAYYGIYCVMMGAFLVGWRFTRLDRRPGPSPAGLARTIEILAMMVVSVIAWRLVTGVTRVTIGPLRIGLQTLNNPMLIVTVLLGVRAWLAWRPVVHLHDPHREMRRLVRLAFVSGAVCLALLSPVIVGIALRAVTGRLPETQTFWRSSPRGVDLLAYLVPNPNHPLFGAWTRGWLLPDRPDAFPEYVASFPLVALAIIAVGARLRILPGMWVAFTALFVALSLGPYIYLGGINTYVIGPWALLRYVPAIGMARAPARFAIVAALGMSILSAFALDGLYRRLATTRLRWAVAAPVIAALVLELCPAPRELFSATVPDVYKRIAATGDESGRVLELPTGIRDGTSSIGNFSAASEFFQTTHRRPLMGGYLSRVSMSRKRQNLRSPMMSALLTLSEGRPLPAGSADLARTRRDAFLRRSCVRFVVVDKDRSSQDLRAFAVDALDLTLLHEYQHYLLYEPRDPPACAPRPRHRFSFLP